MDYPEDDNTDELIDTFCVGCDLPFAVNDLGLCDNCFAKLERDLIRSRDWDHSVTAFGASPDQREALRERVIRDYGATHELIESPKTPKNKRSKSRASQRKRTIASQAVRDYNTEDILQAARDFIRAQNDEWVNFSRVSQCLYETFYHLKPKRLGHPRKNTRVCSSYWQITQPILKCGKIQITVDSTGFASKCPNGVAILTHWCHVNGASTAYSHAGSRAE